MKKILSLAAAVLFGVMFLSSCTGIAPKKRQITEEDYGTVKIGVLFSAAGESAVVEQSMKNAAFMAFDEINANGGINGRQIEYIWRDYASNPEAAAKQIEALIRDDKVTATIGCYTSASRKATLPILEAYGSVLVYPTYTEGNEAHPNVIYTGAVPNQQTEEFLKFMMDKFGKNVFLLGNDYVFSVTGNKYAKRIITEYGGDILGEEYAPTTFYNFESILEKIRRAKPDFIFCDLVGSSAAQFFREYSKNKDITAPVASITLDEMVLQSLGDDCSEDVYTSMSYFSDIDTPESRRFEENYRNYCNDGSVITSLAESAYNSCFFLAKALEKAEDIYDSKSVLSSFSGLSLEAPQGSIKIDSENHCTWLYTRFAKVENGRLKIIYESDSAKKPEPFEFSREGTR